MNGKTESSGGKVYIVISSWGYDGGDDIEQVSSDVLVANKALREIAAERKWEVYEAEDGLFARGPGMGHGLSIQKWLVM